MKRFCFFLLIAILLTGMASAQNRDNRRGDVKQVTVDGMLKLEKGLIAVSTGDSVYYVPMLTRYIGFIEGLKEGARVSVEGYAYRDFLHPTKVTISGKSYDFPGGPGRRGDGFRRDHDGFKGRDGYGPGRGGHGHGWGKHGHGRGGHGRDRRWR